MTNEKTERDLQIKNQKQTWKDNDVSDDLIKLHQEDILAFKQWTKNEQYCLNHLIAWLGWKDRKKNSIFKCPECGHTEARSRPKKEGKGEIRTKNLVFDCKNKECKGSSLSPKAVTIMARSRIPLRFWFLCIYVIGLMKGKVPWEYLNKKRVKFISGGEKVTIQGRSLERIIYKILETCKEHHERIRYSQLVRLKFPEHEPLANYLTWYNTASWVPWRIAFRKTQDRYTIKPALEFYQNSLNADDIANIYACDNNSLYEGEWLLLVDLDSSYKIGDIEWFYVSEVADITDDNVIKNDGYTKLALFLTQDQEGKNNDPFILDQKFKNSLRRYIQPKTLQSFYLNTIKVPPDKILKKIADRFKPK